MKSFWGTQKDPLSGYAFLFELELLSVDDCFDGQISLQSTNKAHCSHKLIFTFLIQSPTEKMPSFAKSPISKNFLIVKALDVVAKEKLRI